MRRNLLSTLKNLLWGMLIAGFVLSNILSPASLAKAAPLSAADPGVISFVTSVNGREDQIRLIDPSGSNNRLFWTTGDMGVETSLAYVNDLTWKPDGSELAFASSHQAACSEYASDVYSIRADGSNLRRIPFSPICGQNSGLQTGDVEVTFMNYSGSSGPFVFYFEGAPAPQSGVIPSGYSLKVTFQNVADFGSKKQYGVAILGGYRYLDVVGNADVIPNQLVKTSVSMGYAYDNWSRHDPSWSYDGKQMAFLFGDDTNPYGFPADDATPGAFGSHLLSGSGSTLLGGSFLAYGPTQDLSNKLLYDAWDDGSTIFLATVGEAQPGQVILKSSDLNGYGFKGLAWLPDGSGFIFSMDEDFGNRANIFRYNFLSGQATRLTDTPTNSWTRRVSVSPDGAQLVYELQTTGEGWDGNPATDLYVMNLDGTWQPQLLVTNGRSPAWGRTYKIVPQLANISPNTINSGGAGFTLALIGSNFTNTSVVRWNGADQATTYVNSTALTIQVTAAMVASPGTVNITVFSPASGSSESNLLTFTINKASSYIYLPMVIK